MVARKAHEPTRGGNKGLRVLRLGDIKALCVMAGQIIALGSDDWG